MISDAAPPVAPLLLGFGFGFGFVGVTTEGPSRGWALRHFSCSILVSPAGGSIETYYVLKSAILSAKSSE
jgi:hypothetical protein